MVDMPGLKDKNLVRVQLTLTKIESCDILMLVCRLSRILTDEDLEKLLRKYGERFRNRFIVVGTRSDDGMIGSGLAKVAANLEKHATVFHNMNACKKTSQRRTRRSRRARQDLPNLQKSAMTRRWRRCLLGKQH